MSSSVGQQKDSPSGAVLPTATVRSSFGSYLGIASLAILDGLPGVTEVGGDGALV